MTRSTLSTRAAAVARRLKRALAANGAASGKKVKLVYLDDTQPGYRRERKGRGFVYYAPSGRRVQDRAKLARFQALVIPPAWTDVWISPLPNGHIQATGRDARGRKQYRYHTVWQETRNATKFERLLEFGAALPGVRKRVEEALALPGLTREKVVAAVIRLLDLTGVRVGNEEYVQQNGSFGLTTLRNRHFSVNGSSLRLRFRGKSGVKHSLEVEDRRLARVVQHCSELPGELLFQYLDEEGEPHSIGSGEVNDVLREWTEQDFTAKDFRTWNGSLLFLQAILEANADEPPKLTTMIKCVASRLGNTPTVCRKYYIHPILIESLTVGELPTTLQEFAERPNRRGDSEAEEKLLLAILGAK